MLQLPTDHLRTAGQIFQDARESLELPKTLTTALNALSRREGVTPYMLLLAAFKTLLYRYTGQEDVIVGTLPTDRRAEFEGSSRFSGTILETRTDLSGDPTFRELLGRVREATLGAHAHQDLPFEKPAEELHHVPLLQVLFSQRDLAEDRSEFPGPPESALDGGSEIANFDLSLSMVQAEERLTASLAYNGHLFNADTMARMLVHFRTLLKGIVDAPEQRLSVLPLLPDAQRHQLLVSWNNTGSDYPQDQCIHQLFEAQVERTPDATAVAFENQQVTYRELNARANRLAHYLQKHGVGPGVLVGICVERSLEMVEGLLGIIKAGGGYVPLDPEHPKARLAYVLQDTGVRLLLVQERLLKSLPEYTGEVFCLDRDRSLLEGQAEVNPEAIANPEHRAYVVYTSGSTGRPKGVLGSHRGVANYLNYLAKTFDLGSADVVLQVPSLSFDASIRDLVGPLTVGARVVVVNNADAREPAALLRKIQAHRVTCLLSVVPTVLSGLVEAAADTDSPCNSIRLVLVSGEPLRLSICRKAKEVFGEHALIVNQYGATECTMVQTYHPVQVGRDQREIALCGRPIPNHQAYILDADLNPVPVGVPGEVHIGGAGLTFGYLNRPDLTAETFIPNPFAGKPGARLYKTGDLARFLPDGNIQLLGRIDHQVKIAGIRVELGEIESVLLRHGSIRDCVVVVRDTHRERRTLIAKEAEQAASVDAADHKRLVAYVVCREGVAGSALRKFLERELPSYMVPGQFVRLDALPLNPNRKVDVKALPEPEALRPELEEAFVAPGDPLESLIAGIWEDVLGLDRVGVNDGFFELGGDSLRAIQVLNRLRQATGLNLSFRDLFETQTVARLARLIQDTQPEHPGVVLPAKGPGRSREYPLSLAQQGIWFLWEMEPNNPYYTSQGIVRLTGALNLPAFRRAWQALLERHDILRVRFGVHSGKPTQVFEDRRVVDLPVTDLSGLREDEHTPAIQRVAHEEIEHPFDLENDPLLRVRLFKLSDHQHALLLTMHEITTDLWSVRAMMRDLGILYDGFLKDDAFSIRPLEVNFGDFALWEGQHINRRSLKPQEEYWRKRLAGDLPVLDLPLDRPRPTSPSYRGKSKSVLLDADLAGRLNALCRQEGTTLFMTLLSAFNVLLHVYAGQHDLIIGAPLANRSSRDAERIVGFFLNMLPLRTDLSGDPGFDELLGRVQETVTGAISNADYPFMWMLEWVDAVRDTRLTPVFQVMFNMLSFPDESLRGEDLEITYRGLETGYTKYDMSLYAQEHGDRLFLQVSYLTDLFDEDTVDRMLQNFVVLLRGIVENPQARISALKILDDAERRTLLRDFNDTQKDYGNGQCIHQLFEAQAERTPGQTALIFDGKRLSYAELNARANRLAHHLRRLGVGPETFVGVCVERSFEMMVALMGIMKAGGAYVALDPHYPLLRLRDILEDTRPPVLIVQKDLDRFEDYRGVKVCNDADWAQIDGADASNPVCLSAPENLLNVVYTSASTGKPKGTLITIGSVLNRLSWMWEAYPFRPNDVAVLQKSYALVAATWECFGALLKGIPTVILSRRVLLDPAELWKELVNNKVSYLLASPAFLQGVLDQGEVHPGEWRNLRLATTSAEPITPAMVARWKEVFPHVPLLNLYGSTECSSNVTEYDTSQMTPELRRVPVGKPLPNTKVYVLNEHLEPVPIGATGEMCVAGACVARGYLNRPELTASRFVPNPYSTLSGSRLYRTGDFARYRIDGTLELVGRRDHRVKVRGFRVELGDVEAVLLRHEMVRDCAVTLYEDGVDRKRLVAYVVAEESVSPSALRGFLRERLPDYMVPSDFVRLETLPLTPNGKVDRRALPIPDQARQELGVAFVPPRTPVEEVVTRIWSQVLSVEQVGIHDNFFEMGGHSLLAVQLMFKIRQAFNKNLPLATLFQAPTVASLSLLLAGVQDQPTTLLVPIRSRGTRPPLFCIHPIGGGIIGYKPMADLLSRDQPVYGIQSRALVDATQEYATIEAMGADYANVIRSQQPDGPYYLLGLSMGGVVAMAIASALEHRGQQVAFVGLLDTSLPANRHSPADGSYLLRRALNLGGPFGRALATLAPTEQQALCDDLKILYDDLLVARPEERLEGIRNWFREKNCFSPDILEDIRQQVALLNTHDALLMSHQPGTMRAPLYIWWARDSLARERHAHADWSRCTTGAVHIEMVGGNHFTMVQPPHVHALVERLAKCLEDIQATHRAAEPRSSLREMRGVSLW